MRSSRRSSGLPALDWGGRAVLGGWDERGAGAGGEPPPGRASHRTSSVELGWGAFPRQGLARAKSGRSPPGPGNERRGPRPAPLVARGPVSSLSKGALQARLPWGGAQSSPLSGRWEGRRTQGPCEGHAGSLPWTSPLRPQRSKVRGRCPRLCHGATAWTRGARGDPCSVCASQVAQDPLWALPPGLAGAGARVPRGSGSNPRGSEPQESGDSGGSRGGHSWLGGDPAREGPCVATASAGQL